MCGHWRTKIKTSAKSNKLHGAKLKKKNLLYDITTIKYLSNDAKTMRTTMLYPLLHEITKFIEAICLQSVLYE